jgi:tetratricopeptide (TPR) repeat protein
MVAPRIAVVALLVAGVAHAQDLSEVQKYLLSASRLYQGLEYERALEQLKRAKSVAAGVSDDAVIDRYEGIVLFDLGKRDEALAAFKEALYLEPDATLPIKVSPKITEAFEATRVKVKKELEPILAKRKAEEEARKAAAERERVAKLEAERAETARKEAAEREALARTAAEEARKRADDAQKQKLADLTRREEEARAAEAKLQEARRLLAEDEKKAAVRRAEAAKEAARLAEFDAARRIDDKPTKTTLVPETVTTPIVVVNQPRPTPVAPFIFGGATLAAGGVAVAFGIMANEQLAAARAANFQSDTNAALQRAQTDALVTNVAIGVAGAAALATLISAIASAP